MTFLGLININRIAQKSRGKLTPRLLKYVW
jgi:hypothetical protein